MEGGGGGVKTFQVCGISFNCCIKSASELKQKERNREREGQRKGEQTRERARESERDRDRDRERQMYIL